MGLKKTGPKKAGSCAGKNDSSKLEPGSVISFKLDYFGVLSCMTSTFVKKKYIEGYKSC
jgi:hypothetical protein